MLCSRDSQGVSVAEGSEQRRVMEEVSDVRPWQTVRDLQALVKTLAPIPSKMRGVGHGSGMV